MGQFGVESRRWLLSAIKQRKLLVRLNKNHKPLPEVTKSIESLETMLNAYSYENDVNMAKFICQHSEDIKTILPGMGSACSKKKNSEFDTMHYRAVMFVSGKISFKQLELNLQ